MVFSVVIKSSVYPESRLSRFQIEETQNSKKTCSLHHLLNYFPYLNTDYCGGNPRSRSLSNIEVPGDRSGYPLSK